MKLSFRNSLISINGKPLINHPGLVFPKDLVKTQQGVKTETGKTYTEKPSGYINTRDVADLLSCSPSGARQFLHRKKVNYILLRREGGALVSFWDKKQVMLLMSKRCPMVMQVPRSYLSTEDTMKVLDMARSAIYRLVKQGRLIEKKVRVKTSRGNRIKSYYQKASVDRILRKRKRSNETC